MTTDASETMKSEELKRLGFLFEYGALAADLSAKYYDFVKKQTPTALSPGIETLEGAIKAYGMPIVTKVQDVAPKVITEADKRVDGVVEGVSSVYTKYTNGENIKAFKKTREEYLKQIEQLLEDIKTKGFQGSVVSVQGTGTPPPVGDDDDEEERPLTLNKTFSLCLCLSLSLSVPKAEVMGFVNTVKETVMKEGAKRVDSAKANPVYVKTYNTVSEKICTAQETALFKKIIAVLEDIKANKSVAPLVNKSVDMATPYVDYATPYVAKLAESLKPVQPAT